MRNFEGDFPKKMLGCLEEDSPRFLLIKIRLALRFHEDPLVAIDHHHENNNHNHAPRTRHKKSCQPGFSNGFRVAFGRTRSMMSLFVALNHQNQRGSQEQLKYHTVIYTQVELEDQEENFGVKPTDPPFDSV